MSLFDLNLIKIDVVVDNKTSLLAMMVNDLYENKALQFKEAFFTAIKERESVLSTGIGHGIAIPHARHNHVYETKAVVYVLKDELEYDALDGNPVKIIVMLAVPAESNHDYMKALHTITASLRDENDRTFFINCKDHTEIYDFLTKAVSRNPA